MPLQEQELNWGRIAGMTVAMAAHAVIGLVAMMPTHSATDAPIEEQVVQVSFIKPSRGATMATPAPPPPAPKPVVRSPAPKPDVQAAAPKPAATVAVASVQPVTHERGEIQVTVDEFDGRIPITTEDAVDTAITFNDVPLYAADAALPQDFMGEVDADPAEMGSYRRTHGPRFPEESSKNREEGMVVLKVLIDEGGLPRGLVVAYSTASKLLELAALEAVSTWEFKPAVRAGMPSKGWIYVPVMFFAGQVPTSLKKWREMGGIVAPEKPGAP